MIRHLVSAAAFATLLTGQPARAADWAVDAAHSHLGFDGTQLGAAFGGSFSSFKAAIDFDPASPQSGRVTVTVDLASARTGDAQRDGALPGAEWFDVAKFPQAKFEAAGFVAKGGDAYEAPGKLTIRGVSVPCTLGFTLTVAGDAAHAVGHAELVRTAFGVGQGPWSTEEYVAFPVAVNFDLTAKRAG